jgi:ribosomal-protein-alanine N-acetyltransferase
MFVLELSKPSGICLAAEGDEGLIGYLVCSRYADVWHLMNIAVTPEWRRQGVASRLLERLFEEAGADARYTLEVRTSNRGAIAMYRIFGFKPAGHRRRYYHDNGEDALVMWLESPATVGA